MMDGLIPDDRPPPNVVRFMRTLSKFEAAAIAYGRMYNTDNPPGWRRAEDDLLAARVAMRDEAVAMLAAEPDNPEPDQGSMGPVVAALRRLEAAVEEATRMGMCTPPTAPARDSTAAERHAAKVAVMAAISRWAARRVAERPVPKMVEHIRNRLYDSRGRLRYEVGGPLYLAIKHGTPEITVADFDLAFGPPPDPLGDMLDEYEAATRNAQAAKGDAAAGFVDEAVAAREKIIAYVEDLRPC